MREVWTIILTILATQISTLLRQTYLGTYVKKLIDWVSGYAHITFSEYTGENLKRSEAYDAIQNYLSEQATASAKRLKANESSGSKSLVFSIDDNEEVTDEYDGVKVKWSSNVRVLSEHQPSYNDRVNQERRFFTLSFPVSHRESIAKTYVEHVVEEGKKIGVSNRKRKLYTNNSSQDWWSWREGKWSSVPFKHPAKFDTLAMDPVKKKEIMEELTHFKEGKDYYEKIGKPWKRGYLLYGPPGTGKSTMISAMANFLDYDVYDLELTTVKDNSELKRVLLDTKSKSIIVIEDIDCSVDFTGQRSKEKEKDEEEDKTKKKDDKEKEKKSSKVTLSGLLNSIDGLWSACSDEKIIVFTTNYVDKLDPALTRRGRMDNRIEMSYCRFEAFKVLAKNYLNIESHDLFEEIERLLEETDMSPADVAEHLMPKSKREDTNTCLNRLVSALEETREKAQKMAEEEEKNKRTEEEKVKDCESGENSGKKDSKDKGDVCQEDS